MSKVKPPARRKPVPLAPAGDKAFAPLYDMKMRWPIRRAWLQLMVREGVQATIGLPLEHALMGAWLRRWPGCRPIERLGLPRRALEQTLGEALTLHVAPRELIRGVRRSGLPDRQRPSSMTFIWSGEWDQYRSDLRTGSRYSLIRDLAAHRDSLTHTRRFHALAQRLSEGHPWRSHQQGVLLDSRARILIYLRAYLGFLDNMAERGFDAERGKDALGVAVSRDGRLLKINRGLHRLAMAQYLGLETVPVQVRAVHREWWARTVGDATGEAALERLREALGQCVPETAPGANDPPLLAQEEFHWPESRR